MSFHNLLFISSQRRDILTRIKQVRDALRTDNTKLKHKSGLLGNEPLLRDFEYRKDEVRLNVLKELMSLN